MACQRVGRGTANDWETVDNLTSEGGLRKGSKLTSHVGSRAIKGPEILTMVNERTEQAGGKYARRRIDPCFIYVLRVSATSRASEIGWRSETKSGGARFCGEPLQALEQAAEVWTILG